MYPNKWIGTFCRQFIMWNLQNRSLTVIRSNNEKTITSYFVVIGIVYILEFHNLKLPSSSCLPQRRDGTVIQYSMRYKINRNIVSIILNVECSAKQKMWINVRSRALIRYVSLITSFVLNYIQIMMK